MYIVSACEPLVLPPQPAVLLGDLEWVVLGRRLLGVRLPRYLDVGAVYSPVEPHRLLFELL